MYWPSNSVLQLNKIDGQSLTLSWRRSLSYGNQSIDLLCKSIDWFLFDNGLCMKELKKESLFTNFFVQHVLSVCTFILFTSTRFTRFLEENFIVLFCEFFWWNVLSNITLDEFSLRYCFPQVKSRSSEPSVSSVLIINIFDLAPWSEFKFTFLPFCNFFPLISSNHGFPSYKFGVSDFLIEIVVFFIKATTRWN